MQTKRPPPQRWDERQPFRGTTRNSHIFSVRAQGPVTAASRPALAGRSRANQGVTRQGGFQPAAASLWGGEAPYFPAPRIYDVFYSARLRRAEYVTRRIVT